MPAPLKTFIIYARADEAFKNDLLRHLMGTLIASGDLSVWSDDQIRPGEEWDKAIKTNLEHSELVLVLVSADSLASPYINSNELRQAVEQRATGQTVVVPISLKPCGWRFNPIVRQLQGLPKDMQPISGYLDREAAWTEVLDGLEMIIHDFRRRRSEEDARVAQSQAQALEAERRSKEAAEQQRAADFRREYAEEQAKRDRKAFAHAMTADTAAAYAEYLRNFPSGEYAAKARQRGKEAFRRERPPAPAGMFSARNIAIGLVLMVLGVWGVSYFLNNDPPDKPGLSAAAKPADDGMVLIKGGTFQMGSEHGESDEKPVHTVTVSDFYLGRTEVTVAEFKAFIDSKNYQTDAEKEGWSYGWNGKEWAKMIGMSWRDDAEGKRRPENEYNHPVIHVSWNDAKAYCAWRSEKENKLYRLPTEAEWEYAAGDGAKHHKYSWGNGNPVGKKGGNVADESGAAKFNWAKNADNIAVGYNDGFPTIAPVASFDANELGLYDMSGNVWEWCEDYWCGDYSAAAQNNPTGPAFGSFRVFRGGSWDNNPQRCRAAYRNYDSSGYRNAALGFRLARAVSF